VRSSAILAANAVVVCGALLASLPARAMPAPHLNVGHNLRASETSCPSGDQVLNVVYKIKNSLDAGLGQVDAGAGLNDYGYVWWAMIDYVAHVQVVELESGEFCATVRTDGSFESVGGTGPAGQGRLEPGVVGTFQGGYTETFSGTFDNPSGMRTKGSIGTFDDDCDPSAVDGNCDFAGSTRWLELYFSDVADFNFDEWWGLIYRAGKNGVWVNAIDGNDGNITGD
jgi:hypothetical protein